MTKQSNIASSESKIRIGFSPCPNDCFMFDAMLHHKIEVEGLEFEPVIEDVETLNQLAFHGDLAVTKLSYHAYFHITKEYQILNAGSALGNNCGPLLISKSKDVSALLANISNLKIAIPGKHTTANLLFSLAFPAAKNKIEMLFSDIETAVSNGNVDAGLIIHENRFTYEQKGLNKIIDLGEYWEGLVHTLIPLGCIAIKRNLPADLKQKINRVLKSSIEYAFENPKSSFNFVKTHAQEMSEQIMFKHIQLYVNNYSLDLGVEGKRAVNLLFDKAQELGIITGTKEDIFLN